MSRRFRALVAHPQVEALGELAEMLGGLGLQVETARSTVEALNKLRAHPAQVVVTFDCTANTTTFDGVGFLEASVIHAPEALRTTSARSGSRKRCCSSPVRSTTLNGSTCASTW